MQQAAADPAVVTFAELVRRFCAWADSQPGDPLAELKQAQLFLSELQFRVLQLPDLGCGSSVELQLTPETNHAKLTARFSGWPMDSYWEIFDPLDKQDKEAGYGSVAGDLAEIYDELNDGLQLYIAGHVAEAVWDWRFGFDTHWGRHLTSALRAIYSYFS